MFNWRKAVPIYEPRLSGADWIDQGKLFAIGDATLSCPPSRHWHECYEIGYVQSGKGILVQGEEEYGFKTGQVYIINDLEPHMGYTETGAASLFVVHFHPSILDDNWMWRNNGGTYIPFNSNFNQGQPLLSLEDPVTGEVKFLLEKIKTEAELRPAMWQIVVGGLIIQIVGILSRQMLNVGGVEQVCNLQRQSLRKIRPVLKLIEEQYPNPLTLDEMAEAGCLSRSYCCALFRNALNTTPVAYRNSRRIREGRRLLQQKDLSVNEIAQQVGFSSVQEFDRLFRREMNVTPSVFRNRLSDLTFRRS